MTKTKEEEKDFKNTKDEKKKSERKQQGNLESNKRCLRMEYERE